jgi:hypothetical protein
MTNVREAATTFEGAFEPQPPGRTIIPTHAGNAGVGAQAGASAGFI